MSGRILVVDDEPQILRALKTSLRGAGYEVDTADTAEGALTAAALVAARRRHPRPRAPRRHAAPTSAASSRTWTTVPVIVLSAVGDESEKVAALDAGADDYVTKPFGVDELLARLRAAMRRVEPSREPVLEIGELRVDLEKQAVSFAGKPVQLTPHEFDSLRLLRPQRGEAPHARDDPARGVGAGHTPTSRTTSTSTSRSSAGRSSPTRRGRATSSPSPVPATASSIRVLRLS